jgi:hypothetical protein
LLEIAEKYPDVEIQIYESSFKEDILIFTKYVFASHKEQIEFLRANQYTEKEILDLIKNL